MKTPYLIIGFINEFPLKSPGIVSGDIPLQKRRERQAVNSTIQGTAADIVKMAMIQVEKMSNEGVMPGGRDTKLLLQIHDELFFETTEEGYIEVSLFLVPFFQNPGSFIVVDRNQCNFVVYRIAEKVITVRWRHT